MSQANSNTVFQPEPVAVTMPQLSNVIHNAAYGAQIGVSYRESVKGLTYTVVVRDGANADMVNETKRHYVAAALQATHANTDFPADKLAEYSSRSEAYESRWSHHQPRVQVWGEVPVSIMKDGAVRTVTVNVNLMTEYTAAVDLLAHLRMVASTVYIEPIPETQPTPTPEPMPQKEDPLVHIMLPNGGEIHVPKREAPAATPNLSHFSPDSTSASGTPHFLTFPRSKPEKLDFAAGFNQKVVSFDMHRIVREWSGNPPTAECLFYADPNGQPDKWPAFRAKVDDFIRDQATKDFLLGLPQDEVRGNWRVVVFCSLKGDKVYFNLNKVETATPAPTPSPDAVNELDAHFGPRVSDIDF